MAFAAEFKSMSCEVTLNIPGGKLVPVMRLFLRNSCYRLFKLGETVMSGGSVLMLLLYMYNTELIETIAVRA